MAIWTIDPMHTEIGFKVKHLVISTVSGKFNQFDGRIESENEDFSDARISFTADIDSISTGNEQRDGHLKSADFFDAANHPQLKFESTSFSKKGDDYELQGNLTIRGTTRPITMSVEFGGVQTDMYGRTVAGFELTGKIKRLEYGLQWNAVTEAGGVVVSDEVKLVANVEVVKE